MAVTAIKNVRHPHSSFEAQLQATLNLIPAHAWYAAPHGALRFVNRRSADYGGLPGDHPLRFGAGAGEEWDLHIAFLHPHDQEETRRAWANCLRTGSAGDVGFRVRSGDGGYNWFLSRAEPVRDIHGTVLYWIGVNLEIEERKQAEFYLAEGQRLTHTGSWAYTPAGFEYWSPELFRIHGLDPERKAPTTDEYLALVHPEDRESVSQAIEEMFGDGVTFDFTKRIVRPDGTIRTVRCVGVPWADGGPSPKLVGTAVDVTEQMQLLDSLQRREAYLAEAQRLSHTGSFGWSVSSDEHFWSDETFRIFEFSPSSPVSLPMILARVHPEDMPAVNLAIGAANRAESIDLEFRLVTPDGRIKHLHIVGKARRGEANNVEVIGAVMDVTARKLTEIELRRSKAHLADAQKLSRTGFVGMEARTKRIFWSEEAARIYGYPPGTEPSSELILQRAHPDDLGLVRDVLERAAQGASDFDWEHRLLMPDGSIKHLRDLAHRVRDEAGNEEVVGAIMDITERKIAEEAIRRQEAELRQMLDFAPQLIAVYGPSRERLFANRVALDYAGVSLEEWRQTTAPGAFTHPDDRQREVEYFARAGSNGSPGQLELRIRGRDGIYRWFLVRYNAVRGNNGQVLRWHVSCTDIEDRKVAEERLREENVALREEIDKASMFEEIVGTSPPLQAVLSRISKVAPTDSTVLITGETGTGKELVARAIHRRSNRAPRAFISVNCAAIPRDLVASELFGHEKGAFTGAMQRRIGRFELAEGGTIFLDEVGELSPDTQVALLRVLQEREFERVGGAHPVRINVRVIAATNRDLKAAVTKGDFREDLFYRLNVFPLELPPLRARKTDIALLVEYFIDRYARKAGKAIRSVEKKTLQLLQAYPWPGNIRELQNVIERSVIVSETETFTIDESWLSQSSLDSKFGNSLLLPDKIAATEKEIIEEALRECQGRVAGPTGAAATLGIARSTLESKIRALNINKLRFRNPADS